MDLHMTPGLAATQNPPHYNATSQSAAELRTPPHWQDWQAGRTGSHHMSPHMAFMARRVPSCQCAAALLNVGRGGPGFWSMYPRSSRRSQRSRQPPHLQTPAMSLAMALETVPLPRNPHTHRCACRK